MIHVPVPFRLLALIMMLFVVLSACSTPDPVIDTGPGDDPRVEAPQDDSEQPNDDGTDQPGNDDGSEPGDDDGTDQPGDDDGSEPGDNDNDNGTPPEAPLQLSTVLRVHTMLDAAGDEVTTVILSGNVDFDESAPAATTLTVTLLTGSGTASGDPLVLDVAEGDNETHFGTAGHDWGTLIDTSYSVQVDYAGGRSFSEHDLSGLPYGLERPSDIAITMTSPTTMRVTFEPASDARVHHVTASYVAEDGSERSKHASGPGQATVSSAGNFDLLLGQEYLISVFADVAERHDDQRTTRVTSEAAATLTLSQVPVISAWAGPIAFQAGPFSGDAALHGRVFVTLPAGAEPGTEVEIFLSVPAADELIRLRPDFGAGTTQSWFINPLTVPELADAVVTVTLSSSGEPIATYTRTFEGVAAAGTLSVPTVAKAGMTAEHLSMAWEPVAEATVYMVEVMRQVGPDAVLAYRGISGGNTITMDFTDEFRIDSDNLDDYFFLLYALDGDPDDPAERLVRAGLYANNLSAVLPPAVD